MYFAEPVLQDLENKAKHTMNVHFRPNNMSYVKCSFLEISFLKSQIRFLNTGPQIYLKYSRIGKHSNLTRSVFVLLDFVRFLHRQYDTIDQTN